LLALVNIVGTPYTILMPIFARDILHGGPHTLGFIMTAVGIGALVGAIFLASRQSPRGLGKILGWAAGIFGVGLMFFSLSRQVWLSLFVMLFTGFGMLVNLASSNTVLQTIADEDKRGRVMSLYTMGMRGMMPFGSLLAGGVAAAFGAPFVLLIGGASCAVGAVVYSFSIRSLRQTSPGIEVFEPPTLLRRHGR
jgi:MFS family permease